MVSTYILLLMLFFCSAQKKPEQRPNILFCIADDASFQHMTAYGYDVKDWVSTPGFDKVALEGILFKRAYTPNAKCAPSRASILTGRNSWQLEEAANHNPYFPLKFTSFMEALGQNGYRVGFTGKGWAPGNTGKKDGKPRSLTGPEYSKENQEVITTGITKNNYTGNFKNFLESTPKDKPFCFWYGSREPHRKYEYGSGISKGNKKIDDIKEVPPFWPDSEKVRNDMLDYALEVEHFDSHVLSMMKLLKEKGQLDNTIIVVTSDNGMPFPRVKGHMYDYDNHLPLAIMWKDRIKFPGRKIDDFVSFIDLAPTFLEAADVEATNYMQPIQGRSLFPYFESSSNTSGNGKRSYVLLGREREDVGRPEDQGYPVRAIVQGNLFFAINYEPTRWPSGNPETGYLDTDGSPTKTEILAANRKGKLQDLWQLSFGKKTSEELYRTDIDPYSMKNLANDPAFARIKEKLKAKMEEELKKQKDPRMLGNGDVFDHYKYANPGVRNFYERYMDGEKIPTPWVNPSDFERNNYSKKMD